LFELSSNPSYEDYIKDSPTLSGIDDKENIIELYILSLSGVADPFYAACFSIIIGGARFYSERCQ